ncbi:uncharacterized protein LOC126846569 [Adelges cooleyi]|uniref:uncharacterized protein LOC126846569 n=1 Tax=Adelges cooleyi TaxID=133065 RepID=UPI0021804942|nr:uncharacterized protein LOC126846569 [Adelges cooleyi]XP_050442115.1 uncharacterized protein LOC126846569 [Adelges cooleyi]XP_050442116.1 uncharacterized protein LOC126846569 [Adelges cooleyi]XP_050442117.1 uncharacterized protein LOC126846569 [Adelges cooleyi]
MDLNDNDKRILNRHSFYFFNRDLTSLKFMLDWDTDDKFYFNIVDRGIGNIVDKADGHTMVLSNPSSCTYHHPRIPAFNINYIKDCILVQEFLDPRKYLITVSCPIDYKKKDILSCWFHNQTTWYEELPDIQLKENSNGIILPPSKASTSTLNKDIEAEDDSDGQNKLAKSSNKDKKAEDDSNFDRPFKSGQVKLDKRTRMAYSHKEDSLIVKYLIKNNDAFNVFGRELWQRMESSGICKIRTWQSLKERYLKHIRYDLLTGNNKYPFLSSADLKLLRQGLKIESSDPKTKEKQKFYSRNRQT